MMLVDQHCHWYCCEPMQAMTFRLESPEVSLSFDSECSEEDQTAASSRNRSLQQRIFNMYVGFVVASIVADLTLTTIQSESQPMTMNVNHADAFISTIRSLR